ncbi:MAG: hypothetical protein J0I07_44895 [Myxococcales bacterium]|nr:hypothetical protein [Myxococcales bacterium]
MRYMGFVLVSAMGLGVFVACSTGSSDRDDLDPDAGASIDVPLEDSGHVDEASADGGADEPDAERPLICEDGGFCETRLPLSPLGQPPSLSGVWAVSSDDVWSVSSEGSVLHYDGKSWRVEYQTGYPLRSVWATSRTVWVGGAQGIILRRDEAGVWKLFESGHASIVRSIFGSGESDVWLSSRDGYVDHFDGSTLTTYPLGVPGLRTTTVFGRPGVGVYAGGYVPGAVSGTGRDESRFFALSVEGATALGLTLNRGRIAAAGAVFDVPAGGRRFVIMNYGVGAGWISVGYSTLDENGNFVFPSAGAGERPHDVLSADVPPAALWGRSWDDVYVANSFAYFDHWNGVETVRRSLNMGPKFPPRTITGTHGTDKEMWIVGAGFALKGHTL